MGPLLKIKILKNRSFAIFTYMPDCASALALLCPPPWTTHHRAPSSASRPASGCHTAQGVSQGARVAVRCQGSHHTAVQRPTTRPSCWSLLLLPAATSAHYAYSPATPSQLTQGRHRAVRSARDVPGSVDPAGMAKWGREGARSLNCRIYVCLIKFPPTWPWPESELPEFSAESY